MPATALASRHLIRPRRAGGFTLIEVLVSLLILSVLAATAWKGMESIGMARTVADGQLKQTLRLQAVMTQFEADMAQVLDTSVVIGMQFDGAHLRFTRRSGEGVQTVVWYTHQGRLLRWASPITTRVGDLQKYWFSSYQLQGREPGTLTALRGVEQWQVFCFRSGAMSNCQSSGDAVGNTGESAGKAAKAAGLTATQAAAAEAAAAAAAAVREQLPNAVRVQMTLGQGSGFTGRLTRDVLLAPQMNQN